MFCFFIILKQCVFSISSLPDKEADFESMILLLSLTGETEEDSLFDEESIVSTLSTVVVSDETERGDVVRDGVLIGVENVEEVLFSIK
jgi:hypothetical protein